MSKYQPLVHHLDNARSTHVPMSFQGVEQILKFTLPRSARQHQAWWANTGSHVHAVAWMRRGWRTSAVDLAGEKVTFVREPGSRPGQALSASDDRARAAHSGEIVVAWSDLQERHQLLLQAIAKEKAIGLDDAVSEALDMAQRDRRRRTIEWAEVNSPKTPSNSVDMIREDRDRDEY